MPELKPDDLDRLVRELTSFARSGIPLPEGLNEIARSSASPRVAAAAASLADATGRGVPLSKALEALGPEIPPQLVALVKCGEQSGSLPELLEFAVDHSRRVARYRETILTSMVYPVVVIVTLIVVLYLVSNYIAPKIQEVFVQLGAELPVLSQVVLSMCRIFQHGVGGVVTLILLALAIGVLVFPPFQERFRRFLSFLPGFRHTIALSDTAISMRILENTTKRGVPLPDALNAASLAVFTRRMRVMLADMSVHAGKGHSVGPMLANGVPSIAAWMFRNSEERGDLADGCRDIANYCEDRFDVVSKRAISILEPALVLMVGVMIFVVIAGFYLPLFSIPKIVGMQ